MRSPEPQQLCVSSWVHSCPPDPPQSETAGRSSLSEDDLSAPLTEGDRTDSVEWVPWIVLVMVFEDEEMLRNMSLFASVWFGSFYHLTDQYHTKVLQSLIGYLETNTGVWHQQLNVFSILLKTTKPVYYISNSCTLLFVVFLLSMTLSGLNCIDTSPKNKKNITFNNRSLPII